MSHDEDDEYQYDENWPPKAMKGVRKGFTAADDKNIILYLLKTRDVVHLKGYEVWKRLQHSKKYNPRGFAFASLHERWRRTIMPSIDRYGLKDSEKELLLCKPRGYFSRQREATKNQAKRSLLDQLEDCVDSLNVAGPSKPVCHTSTEVASDSDSSYRLQIVSDSEESLTSGSTRQTGRRVESPKPWGPELRSTTSTKRRGFYDEEESVKIDGSVKDPDPTLTPSRILRNNTRIVKTLAVASSQALARRTANGGPGPSRRIYSSTSESSEDGDYPARTSPRKKTLTSPSKRSARLRQTALSVTSPKEGVSVNGKHRQDQGAEDNVRRGGENQQEESEQNDQEKDPPRSLNNGDSKGGPSSLTSPVKDIDTQTKSTIKARDSDQSPRRLKSKDTPTKDGQSSPKKSPQQVVRRLQMEAEKDTQPPDEKEEVGSREKATAEMELQSSHETSVEIGGRSLRKRPSSPREGRSPKRSRELRAAGHASYKDEESVMDEESIQDLDPKLILNRTRRNDNRSVKTLAAASAQVLARHASIQRDVSSQPRRSSSGESIDDDDDDDADYFARTLSRKQVFLSPTKRSARLKQVASSQAVLRDAVIDTAPITPPKDGASAMNEHRQGQSGEDNSDDEVDGQPKKMEQNGQHQGQVNSSRSLVNPDATNDANLLEKVEKTSPKKSPKKMVRIMDVEVPEEEQPPGEQEEAGMLAEATAEVKPQSVLETPEVRSLRKRPSPPREGGSPRKVRELRSTATPTKFAYHKGESVVDESQQEVLESAEKLPAKENSADTSSEPTTGILSLRRLMVVIPAEESELTKRTLSLDGEAFLKKTQNYGTNISSQRTISTRRRGIPEQSPTTSMNVASNPRLGRAQTKSPTTSSFSLTNNGSSSPEPLPSTTHFNCTSPKPNLMEISITTRCRAPLPQPSGRWPPKVRLLRDSVEKTLTYHNQYDLMPHDKCPGLREYIEMWAELKELIKRANASENRSATRKWRESRVASHVSEILSMQMCPGIAGCGGAGERSQAPKDAVSIFSHLNTPEWRMFIEFMSVTRDVALSRPFISQ